MFKALLQKEILENMLSLRVLIGWMFSSVLIISSAWLLADEYRKSLDLYNYLNQIHRNEAENFTDPGDLGWLGINIDREPKHVEILFGGVAKYLPKTVWISNYFEPRYRGRFSSNPIGDLFPIGDWLYLLAYVLSLIALITTFDSICGEKTRGTLKLILSYPASRLQLLLAKLVAGVFSVTIPLAISSIFAVIIIYAKLGFLSMDAIVVILIALFLSLLYLTIWLLVGLLISAMSSTEETALVKALLVWVLFVFILPNLTPLIASQLSRTIPAQELAAQHSQMANSEANTYHSSIAKINQAVPAEQYRLARWQAWNDFANRLNQNRRKLNELFYNQLNKQIDLATILARISPLAVFNLAITKLADTSLESENEFQTSISHYQDQLNTYLDSKARTNKPPMSFNDLPIFQLPSKSFWYRLQSALVDIFLLIVFVLVIFIFTFKTFTKYDVR